MSRGEDEGAVEMDRPMMIMLLLMMMLMVITMMKGETEGLREATEGIETDRHRKDRDKDSRRESAVGVTSLTILLVILSNEWCFYFILIRLYERRLHRSKNNPKQPVLLKYPNVRLKFCDVGRSKVKKLYITTRC